MGKQSKKRKPPKDCKALFIREHRHSRVYGQLQPNECIWYCTLTRKEVICVKDIKAFKPTIIGHAWIESHHDLKIIRYIGELKMPETFYPIGWDLETRRINWERQREIDFKFNSKVPYNNYRKPDDQYVRVTEVRYK